MNPGYLFRMSWKHMTTTRLQPLLRKWTHRIEYYNSAIYLHNTLKLHYTGVQS